MNTAIAALCQITDPLSARVACVAASLFLSDQEAEWVLMEANHFALQLGMAAANSGEPMPLLFSGLRNLESCWKEGRELQSDLDEVAGCPCCHRPDGVLCPFHDYD